MLKPRTAILATFILGLLMGGATNFLPAQGDRRIASESKESAKSEKEGDAKTSEALKACLAESISAEQVKIKKQRVYDQDFDVAGLSCTGEKAKALYDSLKSKPQAPYKDREIFVRYLGSSTVPSLCSLAVSQNQNTYSCFIRLDLNKDTTKELR